MCQGVRCVRMCQDVSGVSGCVRMCQDVSRCVRMMYQGLSGCVRILDVKICQDVGNLYSNMSVSGCVIMYCKT